MCLWRSWLPWSDTPLTCSLFEVLGQGKASTVYKGRKKQTICYFAIKRVPKDAKARVLQEVRQSFTMNISAYLSAWAPTFFLSRCDVLRILMVNAGQGNDGSPPCQCAQLPLMVRALSDNLPADA